MDYDGQPRPRPDVTTRGIMVLDEHGCVIARYYLNVFPTLDTSRALGHAVSQRAALPARACPVLSIGGTPELSPAAAQAAGIGTPASAQRRSRSTDPRAMPAFPAAAR